MTPMTLKQIWIAFQVAHLPPRLPSQPTQKPQLQYDNPFLINFVVYHHYRSLGWVVKGGIKFCVDYLLYKRGPVFHHAEYVSVFYKTLPSIDIASVRFALVVIPVYEDPEDQKTSVTNLQNASPFAWSWLSTINRVNSQVQKVPHISTFLENTVDLCLDSHPRLRHNPSPFKTARKHSRVSCMSSTLLSQRSHSAAVHSSTYA